MDIDPPGLGLAQLVTRGRDALVLQFPSADRPIAFSTNIYGGGRVVLSGSDSCMGRIRKCHWEQSLNCSSRISEGALFQGTVLVRILGVQGSSPAMTGRQGIFLFDYTGAGEICASCLMRKAVAGRRNKQ